MTNLFEEREVQPKAKISSEINCPSKSTRLPSFARRCANRRDITSCLSCALIKDMSKNPSNDSSPKSEMDELADAWLKYHEILESTGDLTGRTIVADDYLWAIERIDDLVRQDADVSWNLIMELFQRAKSDYQLACLASGLLEDFLVAHGRNFIDRVERAALSNSKFRETLVAVWKNEIPDDVWARIENARKPLE